MGQDHPQGKVKVLVKVMSKGRVKHHDGRLGSVVRVSVVDKKYAVETRVMNIIYSEMEVGYS